MGIRSSFAKWLQPDDPTQKAGAIWGSEWTSFMGIPEGTTGTVQEYTGTKGDFNRAFYDAWIYRCVDVRGSAITQAPLRVWTKDNRGKRRSVDHDALEVLSVTNPMGWLPGDKLKRATLASLDLHGHYCWQLAFSNGKLPSEIYFMPPGVYEPVADKKTGFFVGCKIREGDLDRIVPAKQLVYDATMSLTNPVKGTSKISAARTDLNLRQYSQASNLWFFRNNMRPDWVLSGGFAPTQENVERLRRLINQWAGGDNRRGPLILGGGDYKASLLTAQHKDAEWLAQMRVSQEALAGIFGVPMPMMNDLSNATLANVDAYKLIFWHDTMTPELKDLADSLTRTFLWRWPDARQNGLEFGFDLAQVEGLGEDLGKLWEREFQAASIYTTALKDGGLTPNDWRKLMRDIHERLGMDSTPFTGGVPQGDDRLVNWNFIPSQQADVSVVLDAMAMRGMNGQMVQNPPALPPGVDFESAAEDMQNNANAMAQAAQGPAQPPAGPAGPTGSKPPAKSANTRSMPLDARRKPQEARKDGWPTPHPGPIRQRRLAKVTDKATKRFKVHFQGLQKEALRTLRGQKADPPVIDPGQDLYDRLRAQDDGAQIAQDAILESGQAAYDAAGQDFGLVGVSWDVQNPWVAKYMGKRIPLIKGIEQTTADDLKTALTEGAQAGESIPDLAERVTAVFRDAIDGRAELIARTETIQAYGSASLAAYGDAGVEKAQIYDGTGDDECAAVAGEVVDLSEADSLMADEHPNGTRGVAPYFPDSNEVNIPKAAEPDRYLHIIDVLITEGKADRQANQEVMTALLAVVKDVLNRPTPQPPDLIELAKALKQDINIELPQPAPVTVNQAPVTVQPAEVTFEKGSIDARGTTTIAEGAIQSRTTISKGAVEAPITINVPEQLPVIIEEAE